MRPETQPKRYFRMRRLLSVFIVVLTALGGGLLSWQISRAVHGTSDSPLGDLLPSFGPAALFASGKGMILPIHGAPPELDAFLNGRTTSFDPAQVPSDFSGPHIFGSYADTFPLTHWLLFYAVGWTWRLLGIHYAALHVLSGLLGAFTALSLYALFRLGMNRFVSCLGALFTMLLPPFLLLMSSMRDFSKAPFILLFIALAFASLKDKQRPGVFLFRILCLSLVLGAGYGFRQDILICLPVALIVPVAAPIQGGRRPFVRIAGLALMTILFGLCALPVVRGMRHESGSVTSHTLFQGLSREAEHTMRFGDASYDLLLTPSDPETHAAINAHARMRGDQEPMSLYLSPAYARAGRVLFKEWALTFPADLFARGLASIETVLNLAGTTLESPGYVRTGEVTGNRYLFAWHYAYTNFLEPWGPLFLFAALFLIGVRNRRILPAVLLILGYFMAYPSLLFQVRHAFHLAFVLPWALLYLLQAFLGVPYFLYSRRMREEFRQSKAGKISVARSLAWPAGILLFTVAGGILLLVVLRQVQTANVSRMISSYRNRPLLQLETTSQLEDGYQLYKPTHPLPGLEESWNLPLGDAATSYVVLSLKPSSYAFPIQIRYEPHRGAYLTRECIIPATPDGKDEILHFIPVYELADYNPTDFLLTKHRFGNTPLVNLLVYPAGTNKFSGIGLRPDAAPLFNGMYYVEKHAELPWLLFMDLSQHPDEFKAYKRFGWEKTVLMLPVEFRYLRTGDTAQAIEEYFLLLSRYPGNQPYAKRIKKLIPRLKDPIARANALFNLSGYELYTGGAYAVEIAAIAAELASDGKFSQAERQFRHAVALSPDDLWHQAHLADTLLAQGKIDAAVELYAHILKIAPESPYSATRFDIACNQGGRTEYQLRFWESLHEKFPQAVTPALHLARQYVLTGRKEEASALYEGILQEHGDHPETLIRYGALIALETEYAQGRTLMNKGLELNPELGPIFIEELSHLAENYAKKDDDAFAKAIYWETASLAPQDPYLLVNIADTLAAKGETGAAAERYTVVLKTMPESPYSAQKLDELLRDTEKPGDRIRVWEDVHELHPAAIIPALYLAREYEQADRREDALNIYEQILEDHPDHQETLMRKRVLQTSETTPSNTP